MPVQYQLKRVGIMMWLTESDVCVDLIQSDVSKSSGLPAFMFKAVTKSLGRSVDEARVLKVGTSELASE